VYEKLLEDQKLTKNMLNMTLSIGHKQELSSLKNILDTDVASIRNAASTCFSNLPECVNQANNALNNLTPYDESIFNLRINDGLVGHYPLDGNADDVSGYNRHGNIIGTLTPNIDRHGRTGEAFKFDGKSYIKVNTFRNFEWGDNLTVSVWFKRTNNSGYQGILNNGYYTSGSWEIRMGREYGGTMIGGGISTRPSKDTWDFVWLKAQPNNEWHHIIMRYSDGNLLKYYLDGIEQSGGGNDSGSITVTDNPLNIGAKSGNGGSNFIGLIDSIRIYNRTLSDEEIKQLMVIDD
jgi:hypothetical protein